MVNVHPGVDSIQLNEIVVPVLVALKLVGAATIVAAAVTNELDAPVIRDWIPNV
jgi:hypothetical protein